MSAFGNNRSFALIEIGIHRINDGIKKYEYANATDLLSNTFNACGKWLQRQLVLNTSESSTTWLDGKLVPEVSHRLSRESEVVRARFRHADVVNA